MNINAISHKIIGGAINVHKELGPGLLESAYQACLSYELKKMGMKVQDQVPLPLIYEEVNLECGYRVDRFIENQIIVEIKSVDHLADIHTAQVLTYLKLANCQIGLLINFNVLQLTQGVKRLINKYYTP